MAVCQLSVPGAQGGTRVCQKSEARARLIIKMRAPLRRCAEIAAGFANRCCTRRATVDGVPIVFLRYSAGVTLHIVFFAFSQVVSNLQTPSHRPDGIMTMMSQRIRRIILERMIASHPFDSSKNLLADSSSSGTFSLPWRSWLPSISTLMSAGTVPSYCFPMFTSPTRHPFPSTTELVASVDERETRLTFSSSFLSCLPMLPEIPVMSLSLVVRSFALLTISPVSKSMITLSVYVPPVSIPSPYVIFITCSMLLFLSRSCRS